MLLPLDAVAVITYAKGYYKMTDMLVPGAIISVVWVILMTVLMTWWRRCWACCDGIAPSRFAVAQMQTAIRASSCGAAPRAAPFFLEADLPSDVESRDRVLLAALGSPDRRQIDGLGGASPLTSKVGIVRRGTEPGVDLDFLSSPR